QPPPPELQRSQAYSYFVGLFVQVPRSPVSTCPTRAAPKIRGFVPFAGLSVDAAMPEPTTANATALARTPPIAARRNRRRTFVVRMAFPPIGRVVGSCEQPIFVPE